jgi:hypothetical protein
VQLGMVKCVTPTHCNVFCCFVCVADSITKFPLRPLVCILTLFIMLGNYCSVKKPATLNWIEGCGKSVRGMVS